MIRRRRYDLETIASKINADRRLAIFCDRSHELISHVTFLDCATCAPLKVWNWIMPIHLMVDRRFYELHDEVIRIGRDAVNEISLPDDNRLADFHAVIRSVGSRWIIESMSGTSVRLGDGRPSPFAWLNPGDTVLLTEAGPEAVFEPAAAMLGKAAQQDNRSAQADQRGAFPHSTRRNAVAVERTVSQSMSSSKERNAKDQAKFSPDRSRKVLLTGIAIFSLVAAGASYALRHNSSTIHRRGTNVVATGRDGTLGDPLTGGSDLRENRSQALSARVEPAVAVAPQEFLVLVGIQRPSTDDRPHILGIGWLWNNHIAVTSRDIGEAIQVVVAETATSDTPRNGCVIQGLAVGVSEVKFVPDCPAIAILRLNDASGFVPPAISQWNSVEARDIERMRSLAKPITYHSFARLPRPKLPRENHNFPLCEYDPDTCSPKNGPARLLFEQRQHFVRFTDDENRPEMGGLLCDQDSRILGMALPDYTCLWTKQLESALSTWN